MQKLTDNHGTIDATETGILTGSLILPNEP
jgi:hypothetical protein